MAIRRRCRESRMMLKLKAVWRMMRMKEKMGNDESKWGLYTFAALGDHGWQTSILLGKLQIGSPKLQIHEVIFPFSEMALCLFDDFPFVCSGVALSEIVPELSGPFPVAPKPFM